MGNFEGHKGDLLLKEAVYRIDPAGKVEKLLDDMHKPNGLCFSPDERRLAALLTDGRAQVWDLAARSLIAETTVSDKSLLNAVWHPDGKRVVLVSNDTPPRMYAWRPGDWRPGESSPSDESQSHLTRLPFAEQDRKSTRLNSSH